MRDEEWIKTLDSGKKVKFIHQALPDGGAFITAQIECHEVVYSVVLSKTKAPHDREGAESHFSSELSRR